MSFVFGYRRELATERQREQWEREAELRNGTLPKNDPRLAEPVRVKVLRPFRLGGQPVAVGDTVEVERFLADDLCAIGKAERVK